MPSMPSVIHITGVAWQIRDHSLTDEQVEQKRVTEKTDVQIDIEDVGGWKHSLKYKLCDLPMMPRAVGQGISIDNRFPFHKPEIECKGSPRSIVVTCPDWVTIVLDTAELIFFHFPRVKVRG